jgi:hypothetical protein
VGVGCGAFCESQQCAALLKLRVPANPTEKPLVALSMHAVRRLLFKPRCVTSGDDAVVQRL